MSINIQWSPSSDPQIASYNVQRATSSLGAWATITGVIHDLSGSNYDPTEGSFHYSDTDGQASSWYRIIAIDGIGAESDPTSPFQPGGLITAPLATVAELRDYLSISGTASDGRLQSSIDAASSWFESQCGQRIMAARHEDEFDGDNGRYYRPMNQPLLQVLAVEVDGETVSGSTAWNVEGWVATNGSVKFRGSTYRFNEGVQNCKVVYVAGHPVCPPDAKQAVIMMAALWFREASRVGHASDSALGVSTVYMPNFVPQTVKDIISTYRRPPTF